MAQDPARNGPTLRTLGTLWVLAAFAAGLAASAMWMSSRHAWREHLTQAYVTGVGLYESLARGAPLPNGTTAVPLSPDAAALAASGDFARLPDSPKPAYVTLLPLSSTGIEAQASANLTLAIVSGDLPYRVADITPSNSSPATALGDVTRLMATYCSAPVLYAGRDGQSWLRITAPDIWSCAAAPRDLRLFSLALGLLAITALLASVGQTAQSFRSFAAALGTRRRIGGPTLYDSSGPRELRDTVAAVNTYLASERDQLAHRALVLSGVSHDLGTPATRLRLRAALIEDGDLRTRLEADIDRMTGMIESVLTLTNAELSSEAPRRLSLRALVEAVVADYEDMGHPVELIHAPAQMQTTHSIFTSRSTPARFSLDEGQVVVTARPVALQRALQNLIDNALKYGRRAKVWLTADSQAAAIWIEDEGGHDHLAQMEGLTGPFRRGENAARIDGYGLGLTIVATIAEQHGGSLSFDPAPHGLRACLRLTRQ
ncbi:Osmolarity sensor protein EnvZ [Aquimixticola soesokkakensis]|uniref:histidine kinase n=1 Tax=Aquimixticola soesokkakensis TaxID=1519096 RepID=A0A1Y5RYZ4_9RHOB|nr:HAMP domain-containing sensor histidine kinase [Aquimixticola soesokkakensis]SLN25814.1 Osmolarity sensor protein EnvZ [Aquimixticola soesokkakensis]